MVVCTTDVLVLRTKRRGSLSAEQILVWFGARGGALRDTKCLPGVPAEPPSWEAEGLPGSPPGRHRQTTPPSALALPTNTLRMPEGHPPVNFKYTVSVHPPGPVHLPRVSRAHFGGLREAVGPRRAGQPLGPRGAGHSCGHEMVPKAPRGPPSPGVPPGREGHS